LQALDELRDAVQQGEARAHTVLGGTTAMATGLSIGYVLWLLRGGLLLSSLLTSLPAWRFVDPLPVLAHVAINSQTDTTDDESLETMVQQDDNAVEEIDA
jgi:hypothetical protein